MNLFFVGVLFYLAIGNLPVRAQSVYIWETGIRATVFNEKCTNHYFQWKRFVPLAIHYVSGTGKCFNSENSSDDKEQREIRKLSMATRESAKLDRLTHKFPINSKMQLEEVASQSNLSVTALWEQWKQLENVGNLENGVFPVNYSMNLHCDGSGMYGNRNFISACRNVTQPETGKLKFVFSTGTFLLDGELYKSIPIPRFEIHNFESGKVMPSDDCYMGLDREFHCTKLGISRCSLENMQACSPHVEPMPYAQVHVVHYPAGFTFVVQRNQSMKFHNKGETLEPRKVFERRPIVESFLARIPKNFWLKVEDVTNEPRHGIWEMYQQNYQAPKFVLWNIPNTQEIVDENSVSGYKVNDDLFEEIKEDRTLYGELVNKNLSSFNFAENEFNTLTKKDMTDLEIEYGHAFISRLVNNGATPRKEIRPEDFARRMSNYDVTNRAHRDVSQKVNSGIGYLAVFCCVMLFACFLVFKNKPYQ